MKGTNYSENINITSFIYILSFFFFFLFRFSRYPNKTIPEICYFILSQKKWHLVFFLSSNFPFFFSKIFSKILLLDGISHTSLEISTASAKFFSTVNHCPKFLKSFIISKNDDDKFWPMAKARVGLKDDGARDSDLNQSLRLYGQFPVEQGSQPSKEEKEKQNYYVNMGYAIRTLREDFPYLFYKELRFDIYRDDIVFKDPLNTFAGIENYKSIFWALRFHGRIFFKALWLDIVGVWQPMENVIMVRWTVHGIPRVPWESLGRFDGTSEYKLDKNGKIFEHRVDNIALNSPPKLHSLAVEDIIRSIGCPSTPRPTYFEISSSSSSERT